MSRHAGMLALAAGLALFGCATGGGTGSADHVPPGWRPPLESDEAGLWLQMDRLEAGLRTSGLRLQNAELEAYLHGIVCRLIPNNCRDIRVYVMRNPFFNASMAPNGMMQVWTGVLLRVEDEAQLAFVLGHEIAHYLQRHSLQTWRDVQRKSAFLSVTSAVLRGSLGSLGGAVQGGVALATVGTVYAFSREHEREADEAGLRLIAQAGYDPSAAPAIWERLLEEQRAGPRSSPVLFFATHPSTPERMVRLRELAWTVTTRGAAERRRAEYLEATPPRPGDPIVEPRERGRCRTSHQLPLEPWRALRALGKTRGGLAGDGGERSGSARASPRLTGSTRPRCPRSGQKAYDVAVWDLVSSLNRPRRGDDVLGNRGLRARGYHGQVHRVESRLKFKPNTAEVVDEKPSFIKPKARVFHAVIEPAALAHVSGRRLSETSLALPARPLLRAWRAERGEATMKRHAPMVCLIVVLAGLLVACEKTIALKPSFWEAKNASIGVAIVKYPEAVAYKQGAQGLLDIVINEAMAKDLKGYLQRADIRDFASVSERFVQQFQERGFAARKVDAFVDLEGFDKLAPPTSGGTYHSKDLRPLAAQENVDLLLLLSVDRFGTVRPYYGFIPLGPPKALFAVKGQLINLRTNELQWQISMKEEEAVVAVEGDWDQPPDFPNLSRALQRAVGQAGPYLETQLFSTAAR